MGDIVKYLARSAVHLHKRFLRQAISVRSAGRTGKKSLIEGYIASTLVKDGEGSVTTVLDLPGQILWMSRNSFDGFSTWYFATVASVGNRDMYVPGLTAVVSPVAVDNEAARLITPDVYQFVSPDYDVVADGTGRAYVHGLPDVREGWVYGVVHARIDVDGTVPITQEELVITVYGARWSAAVRQFDANNALVLPGPEPDELLPSNKTRIVCIPALTVAAAAGKPDAVIRQIPNNVFIASVQVRETPVTDQPNLVRIYTAVGGRDPEGETLADEPLVIVGRLTLTETQEQELDWGAAPVVAGGELAVYSLNVLESIGLYVGLEVTTCSVAFNAGSHYFQTMIHRLDINTGAVLDASTFTLYPELSQPLCSSRDALWLAKATTEDDVSIDCSLYRVVDGLPVMMNTAGWMPVCTLLPGVAISDDIWSYGAMAPTVIELGDDRVGFIACAAGAYTPYASINWYLVELEVSTQSFVEVRGLVGVMSLQQLIFNNPRPLAITVVTPQVLNDDGTIKTPAVLIKNEFLSTSISTDGGFTWHLVATEARGYPYYFGNQAHSFQVGENL